MTFEGWLSRFQANSAPCPLRNRKWGVADKLWGTGIVWLIEAR